MALGAGGNNSKYGLFLNSNLQKGESFECLTYNNKVLSKNSNFQIKTFEVIITYFVFKKKSNIISP